MERLFQFYVSSWLLFVASALCIELTLYLFKVVSGRVSSLCRAVPFAQLALMGVVPFLMEGSWGLNLNVFGCEGVLHSWNPFHLLPDYATLMHIGSGAVLAWAGVRLGRQIVAAVRSYSGIQAICREAALYNAAVSPGLKNSLARHAVTLLVTDAISIPQAVPGGTILLPKSLTGCLSHQEIEAVIAHELEHVRWSDIYVVTFARFVQAIYWWIPINTWLNKLCEDQEVGCDLSIHRYALDPIHLADAMLKVAHCNKRHCLTSYLTGSDGVVVRRIALLLSDDSGRISTVRLLCVVIFIVGAVGGLGFALC